MDLDVSYEEASEIVPNDLYNHLAWIIHGTPFEVGPKARVSLSQKQHEQVLNIGQDIISAMSSIPTPKQVGIALHIIKQTRSKETVTLLNRFGNSISYYDAQRYITSMALRAEDQVLDQGFFIPENIKHGLFTHFAFDNLDFHENNVDGKTTHGTTHIIYQYQPDASGASVTMKVPLQKPRKPSLETSEQFQTKSSMLTLSDRRQSRSLCGMKLVPDVKPEDCISATSRLDFLFNLCQSGSTNLLDFVDELKPTSWKQFHEVMINDKKEKTIIGYGPFFPQSPNNPDVVAESVNYCIGVARKLGQEHCVITCDQAIYEIVLALHKKHPDKYGHVIIRMGGFHIAMNFLGAIGHLMKETGIEEILAESEICQPGTVSKLLDGKDYYTMLHAHRVVARAMFGLLWESFESWTLEEGNETEDFSNLSTCLGDICRAINEDRHENAQASCMQNEVLIDNMRKRLGQFIELNLDSPTCKLWTMYLDMIGILERFIAAERSGNWQEHINATEEMLPYILAAGHNKYTACLPHYLSAMKDLPAQVKSEFLKGNFAVHEQKGKFNGVWSDMALEKTYNKDAKTKLLHGITQRPDTISKYLRALPSLTAVSEKTLQMAHMKQDDRSEKSTSERDVRQVLNIKSLVKSKMINPFLKITSDSLMNISSGETTESTELVEARQKGLDALEKAEKSNAEKVDAVKLKTFVEKVKKQPAHRQTRELYAEERSVTRELCFAENLDKKEKADAFAHEWTKYPSSIFTPDALHPDNFAMRKGNKADYGIMLKATLGSEWKENAELPVDDKSRTGYFIDLMAFVQRYQDLGSSTFQDLSRKYLRKILEMKPVHCDIVHVVGDRYDVSQETSLKAEERMRRQKTKKKSKSFIPHDNLRIPQWKGFIENQSNKHNLEEYLANSWARHTDWIPPGCAVVLGGMTRGPAKHLSSLGITDYEQLDCDEHEEADTRIFAHINFAAMEQGCRRAIVYASDTDVLMLGIYHAPLIDGLKELWMQKPDRYIPCHWIAQVLSSRYSSSTGSAILSAYALTGCDSVSYIFNCGKKRALKVALECHDDLQAFSDYGMPGSDTKVSDAIYMSASKYMNALYGQKDFSGSLDDLRCQLFRLKKSDIRSLPPTSDAFRLHLMRALYQIIIWKRATSTTLSLPQPTDFGRRLHNGFLLASRMTKPPKPKLQSSKCNCQKDKCRSRCPCRKADDLCTIRCKCNGDPSRCTLAAERIENNETDYLVN